MLLIQVFSPIMKTKFPNLLSALALLAMLDSPWSIALAQGTAFTYQGQLENNGSPANGFYDFQFALSNAPSGGSQIGGTLTNLDVGVTNGLFTSSLDFGAVFTGNAAWLAISVRSNGVGSYVGLNPLQPLTPTPYAIFAGSASNVSGTVSAGQLSGAVALSQLPKMVVTNNETLPVTFNASVTASQFIGSAAGLSGFPAPVVTNNTRQATTFSNSVTISTYLTVLGTNTNAYAGYSANAPLQVNNGSGQMNLSATDDGRLNIQNYNNTEGAIAALYNQTTNPVANMPVGHYAYGASDSSGVTGTTGAIYNFLTNPNHSTMSSDYSFGWMSNVVNTAGSGGYGQQPNQFLWMGQNWLLLPGIPLQDAYGTVNIGGLYNGTAQNVNVGLANGSTTLANLIATNVIYINDENGGVSSAILRTNGQTYFFDRNSIVAIWNIGLWDMVAPVNFTSNVNINMALTNGATGAGMANGTVYANAVALTSDRNAKENFAALDSQAVLAKVAALPLTEWNYKKDAADVRHLGPMAQDFQAAFQLNGADDTHICVVDEGGVALAAIQGLNEKLKEKEAEIQNLRQENDSLAARLSELASAVQALAQKK
jgi:hypothetical protein